MANKSIKTNKSRLILIKKYAFSAINLYGVIKLDDFISLFNHYENEMLTKEDVIPVLELLSSIDEIDLSFRQNLISNGEFLLEDNKDFKVAKDLSVIQSFKPRYLPAKEEFLKYEDEDYIEPMKPLIDLEKFIITNKLVVNEKPDDIRYDVLEIHDQIILGNRMSDYMKYIRQRGYEFKDEVQVNLFAGLVINMHNQTRVYENNGFTPIELRELLKDQEKPVN